VGGRGDVYMYRVQWGGGCSESLVLPVFVGEWGGQSITFLEGSMAMPARPFGKSVMT
jgi:hypothetical protein